jgi:hypothetical protein
VQSSLINFINFEERTLQTDEVLHSKGTELQRLKDEHSSAQNIDIKVIKCLNFRKPFMVKFKNFHLSIYLLSPIKNSYKMPQ